MMKKTFSILILSILLFSSCEYDYDTSKYWGDEFSPKIVLNSVITPDSLITGDLFWTRHIDSGDDFKVVEEFYLKLYEQGLGSPIFEGQCTNGKFNSGIKPKEGLSYRLEINVTGYEGLVKASTYIPIAAEFDVSYVETRADGLEFDHYEIGGVTTSQRNRAIWIQSISHYSDKNYNTSPISYYINNPFCDQVNAVRDASWIKGTGSEIGHDDFIRVSYNNIAESLPLNFAIMSPSSKISDYVIVGEDEFGEPKEEYIVVAILDSIEVLLITPSDDYDKYYKTVYLQTGTMPLPIYQEVVSVHSNIENGVGIFAGFASRKYYFPPSIIPPIER